MTINSNITPPGPKFILWILVAILIATLMSSCSPEKLLSHLVKKHPELVKSDTIKTTVHDTIKAIDISGIAKTSTDTHGVDSILQLFGGKIDSLTKIKIASATKSYIINRPVIQDAITDIVDGVTIKIFQKGAGIGYTVHKPQEIRSKEVVTTINTVTPPAALSWGERFKIWIFDNWWWVALIIFLVWKIAGKYLKKWLPI